MTLDPTLIDTVNASDDADSGDDWMNGVQYISPGLKGLSQPFVSVNHSI
jgi:hypothetical protein